MRTFVAIEIPDPLRKRLEGLQERLRSAAHGVKWVRPASMHLTLKFLGEIRDSDEPRACEIVAECAAESAAFDLALSGVGAFPDAGRPRVIWVGAQDEPAVMAGLHRRLDKALGEVGVQRERRRFQAHLTLGRVRRPTPMPELAHALDRLSDYAVGDFSVAEVILMQSELRPSGPIYTPLTHCALGG